MSKALDAITWREEFASLPEPVRAMEFGVKVDESSGRVRLTPGEPPASGMLEASMFVV